MGCTWLGNNTDSVKMVNGPVKPEYLYLLLMRLKSEYGNPVTIITENGASFNNGEDTVINGKVNDGLRADYIKRHITTALQAKANGANLAGYFVWSGWDNFEWIFGYSVRFGIIYVDYKTQQRIPKQSFDTYQSILKLHQ
jgi:beta-glucosidase